MAHTQTRSDGPDPLSQAPESLRILLVHQRLGAFGGAEANIRITAKELVRRGHSVGLLWAEGTGKDEAACEALFSESYQAPAQRQQILELIRKLDPDVIYLHSFSNLEAMEAIYDFGAPVVRMVHDHSLYCLRSYKYNPITREPCTRAASGQCIFPCLAPLSRNRSGLLPFKWASFGRLRREMTLARRSHALIAYSEFSKSELTANGFDASRIYIHVPMDCRGEAHPISTLSERNLVLFAGQVIRGKGVDLLLKALSRVRSHFQCIIAGDGNHRRTCERLCHRLGLQEKVQFKGYLPPAELERLYLDASVFAFSSIWPEPFGMAGPEAMRFGLPVVGFDAGAVREWLVHGENGIVASWGNTEAFAAGIDALLKDKQRARHLGMNGRLRVNRLYKDANQVDMLEQLFLRLGASHVGNRQCTRQDSRIGGSRDASKSVLVKPIQAAEAAVHV